MRSVKIEIYSDFVCPFCFLAEKPLLQAIEAVSLDIEIDLVWKPFELRPFPTPTLIPESAYLSRVWKESVYPMAERLQTDINFPRVSPQPYSKLAFEGGVFASLEERSFEYHHRIFTAFFQDQLNIGKIDILTQCAAEIGLDSENFRSALENRLYTKTCDNQLLTGQQEHAIQSVPTYIFSNGSRMSGMLGKEQLLEIILNESRLL